MASIPVIVAFLLCSFLQLNTLSLGNSEFEPVCLSKLFDHDYKVLQKLAELEQKQKNLEQRLSTNMGDCSTQRCEIGWVRYGESCYLILNNVSMSWYQGVQHCEKFPGGRLAEFETIAEQTVLKIRVEHTETSGSHPFYWIGATDIDQEGKWVWYSSGTAMDDGGSRWRPGQPNGHKSENCVCLWRNSFFGMCDYGCSALGYIICEKGLSA